MSDQSILSGTKVGTIGGTLTVILANITGAEVLKTAVLAALGAVVSCVISVLFKRFFRKRMDERE